MDFEIRKATKGECAPLLEKYHYLTGVSRGFKSGVNVGLYKGEKIVGAAIFTGFPTPELCVGMLGLGREEQEGLFELSRLVLDPEWQKKNVASWFLSRAIKLLRKTTRVRVILSYADSQYHKGYVYQATNFKYYGLTTPKKDFWIKGEDGSWLKHNRGRVKGLEGEWRPRTQKHRYALVYDRSLTVRWKEEAYPKSEVTFI